VWNVYRVVVVTLRDAHGVCMGCSDVRARVLLGSSLNLSFMLISWSASPIMLSKYFGEDDRACTLHESNVIVRY
jgi:hypothetical protein